MLQFYYFLPLRESLVPYLWLLDSFTRSSSDAVSPKRSAAGIVFFISERVSRSCEIRAPENF